MRTMINHTARIVGIAILLLAFSLAGSGQQDPKKQPTGYWAFVDVNEWATPDHQVLKVYPAKITGKRGQLDSVHSRVADTAPDGTPLGWTQEARWSWEDPPAVMVPGASLSMRLTCAVPRAPDIARGKISADITSYQSGAGSAAEVRFFPKHLVGKKDVYLASSYELHNKGIRLFPGLGPEKWDAGTNPLKMSFDFVGEVPSSPNSGWAKPPGSSDDWISVRVVVDHGRAKVYWYNYKWVKGVPPPNGGKIPPVDGIAAPPDGKSTTGSTSVGEPATVTGMTLQAGKRQVQAGQTVMVPIYLLKAKDVANLNVTMSYDPSVAKTTGAFAKGNLLDKALFELNPKEIGIVRIGFAQNADLKGDGTVAHVTFTATGMEGTRTPLHLEVTTISSAAGSKPPIATIDGEIVITRRVIPGDSDGDGTLTARDAGDALKMSVKLIPVNMVCDVDRDNQVTSTDARLILAKASGRP